MLKEPRAKLDKVAVRQTMNQKTRRRILIVSSLGLIGVIVTLVTGFLVYGGQCAPGLFSGCYGFPLSWRYWIEILAMQYNWFAFIVDVLFYMAVGYALLLILRRVRRFPSSPSTEKS